MRILLFIFLAVGSSLLPAQVQWQQFRTGSSASLRGLSAVSDQVCWTSGSEGSVLRTVDAGKTWYNCSPAGYEKLQFRDMQAFSDSTALVLSAGLPAVILKTSDAGAKWEEVYRNESEGVFFDAMDFWDQQKGIAFSDAPHKKLLIITTADGGSSWQPIDTSLLPDVYPKQGGFAASGTCLRTFGDSKVIIGLGGPEASILLSEDYGQSWDKSIAPLDHGSSSKGIFSFAFSDADTGFCVGGDYRADSVSHASIARTTDAGYSWQLINDTAVAEKYRSSVAFLGGDQWLAVSRTGCSYSSDGGDSWEKCEANFYSLSTAGCAVWASGANGKVARWKYSKAD